MRAPLVTTLMQVSSRFLLVWAVVDSFPFLALSPLYASMLLAWSVTEVIRYSYFVTSLAGCRPAPLTWLRYNTFFVLYPVGILSEVALVYMATVPAGLRSVAEKYLLYAVLVLYLPGPSLPDRIAGRCLDRIADGCAGSFVLYTHMVTQRKKMMRSPGAKADRATR